MKNIGSHSGTSTASDALATVVGSLPIQFSAPAVLSGPSGFTHALGYSYNNDPEFQYCAETLSSTSDFGSLALFSCEMTGGSSGGPWIQPMDIATGEGPIVSINSWGYNGESGMYGPPLFGNSAECLFQKAENTGLTSLDTAGEGDAGVIVTCPTRRNLRASASS